MWIPESWAATTGEALRPPGVVPQIRCQPLKTLVSQRARISLARDMLRALIKLSDAMAYNKPRLK